MRILATPLTWFTAWVTLAERLGVSPVFLGEAGVGPFNLSLTAALSMVALGLAAFLTPFAAAARSARENSVEVQLPVAQLDAQLRRELQGFEIRSEAFAYANVDCLPVEIVRNPAGRAGRGAKTGRPR
jgi:hypothetical protein